MVLRHAQGLNCDCSDPHCSIQKGTCVTHNTPEGTILYQAFIGYREGLSCLTICLFL